MKMTNEVMHLEIVVPSCWLNTRIDLTRRNCSCSCTRTAALINIQEKKGHRFKNHTSHVVMRNLKQC